MATHAGAMPHDRHAERSTLAAGIHSAAHHWDIRHHTEPGDYWFPQHQHIAHALDHLADVGPYPYGTWEQWASLAPQTPPSSLNVRVAAIWTLIDDIPLWVLRRIAEYADGNHIQAAQAVHHNAIERAEVTELVARFNNLTGAS